MTPTLVIGVRVQICQAFGLPEGDRAAHAAKLASDPNNQLPPEGANFPWGGPAENCTAPTLFTSCNTLPPEGANFPWGGPAENCMAPTLATSINHHECPP